jgi:ATP-dependent Lhr-like helicase
MPTIEKADVPAPSLAWAHPIVREWFVAKFGTPTEPQEQGWPHILARRDALISAPTGSGKTLAAFLACIDKLVRQAVAGTLTDTTEVLYISPLKALGNDIQKNLDGPLAEILALAHELGFTMLEIRTAVRTGDTLMPARRAMLDRPPHILVTTPESLYILLTSEKSRAILRGVETVIVDEIHAVADDKRGSHLTLSLERLDALTGRAVPRVGLSATQKPIEVVGQFLVGAGRTPPVIVQVSPRRELDLAIEVPGSELAPVASKELWEEIYNRLAELIREHRSTIVFVNTRRHAERVSHHLAERIGADAVAAHHGSLSRKIRLDAEHRLKTGQVRALVATASLELGIDVGTVDLVCQIGSPRAISVAVQRVGRAGHWRGATPKGRLFATTRDDLIESAALVLAIRRGELDRLIVPEAPLDILAQQIVAACAADEWDEDALLALIRRAYPYRNLAASDYEEILTMLSDGIAARRGRYGAYVLRDRINRRLKGRRGARLAAITGGGAIPETALYAVVAEPEGTTVGTVDEDFAVESLAGDIMLLGNTSWRIRRVGQGRVQVEDAHGAAPTIPFWNGEAPARTFELSQTVAELRDTIDRLSRDVHLESPAGGLSPTPDAAISWLMRECGLDRAGAEQAVEYIVTGRTVLGAVPTQETIIAERFFDEGGGMQLIIHAPFGGRITKAWGLALRKRFCRSFNFELQAAATDDGLNISLAEQHSFPLADVFHFLHPASVQHVLEQAVLPAPVFGSRWRWDASRSLALLRFRGGKRVPLHIQRMQSDDLLASVFPDAAACPENLSGDIELPDHPLVREVMKDVLTEAMDIEGLKTLLARILDGTIRCVAVDTPVPSAFSHEILNANPYAYLDDAPLEERRARAVEMRRVLPESVLTEVGRLDAAAIAEVTRDAWPDVRDADDLHDALQTLVLLPEHLAGSWRQQFEELVARRRAVQLTAGDRRYLVASERAQAVTTMNPGATFDPEPPSVDAPDLSREQALIAALQAWMAHIGPTSAGELSEMLGLPVDEIDAALLRLESSGSILRGSFRGTVQATPAHDERAPASESARTERGSRALASARVGGSAGAKPPGLQQTTPDHDERASASESARTERGSWAPASARVGGSAGAKPPGSVLEWCDRRLLARIHRLTLGRLRREIAPVTAAQFMRWLFRWQHVASGSQAVGPRGTLEVIQQLQGFETPANAWEPHLLNRRIARYDPGALDELCLTGAIGWGRLSPHPATVDGPHDPSRRVVPTSVAPITFFVRDDADWMASSREHTNGESRRGLSAAGVDTFEFLNRAGASFFADIVRGTRRLKAEVETALWELVAAGLVTADGFDNLRALIDPRRRAGHGSGRTARPRHSTGRWALLHSGAAVDPPARLEATCWMLLRRYGVVFRELLARETVLPKWRDLLLTFRRLEDRGEVRGGRFVSGFIGEQFALPIAVDSLRAERSRPAAGETVTISAADPLNLVGIVVPGEKVPSVSGRFVAFKDGIPEQVGAHATRDRAAS